MTIDCINDGPERAPDVIVPLLTGESSGSANDVSSFTDWITFDSCPVASLIFEVQ